MSTWKVTSVSAKTGRELPPDRNIQTREQAEEHAAKLIALGYVSVHVVPETFG